MNTERRILIMDWKSKIMSENFYVFDTLFFNFKHCHVQMRDTLLMAQLVEVLLYKPEGRGFDSRWCHWKFSSK